MSVRGRAWSPVHPLSATDLVYLLGGRLDHRCGCSSSLSATDLMHLSGEELVHHCHHVSAQIQRFVLLLRAVGSAFIGDAMSGTSSMGNVQVRGFMLGEHGHLCSSVGLCMS